MKRVQILYKGNVQGVGFRFTTRNIAIGIGVTGYVKNLSDGNVMLVAEGEEEALKSFINAVNEDMASYISEAQIDWDKATGQFKIFGISF